MPAKVNAPRGPNEKYCVSASATGADDTARLYDSSGDDTYEAQANASRIHGIGFDVQAQGFGRVYAYASGGVDRALFTDTVDDDYYREVIKAFVDLYKEGKIYRGYRMVNWDPANKSAISDEEVLYRTVNGKLWHIRYPVIGSDKFIIVATTRPETMLGDTGVAVNPNDERYKDLIGKKVKLPIVGREIPIFADEYVDMEFGTGATDPSQHPRRQLQAL